MARLTMADSINSPATTGSAIPQLIQHSEVVAGYNHGNSWPDYNAYLAARPDLAPFGRVISITLTPSAVARCLDIENGGAVASQAPAWFKMVEPLLGGVKPWLYTFASNVNAVISAMNAAGITRDRYFIWAAHFNFTPHICSPTVCGFPTADGTQWTDRGAENCDISLINDYMVGAPPPPPDPNHYVWYDTTPRLILGRSSEVQVVKAYDLARAKGKPPWVLQAKCRVAAGRVWSVAHIPGKGGFSSAHRGWRFQQLRHRFKGLRVV